MKKYLLVDLMSDYRDIMSYKELKDMVVNNIVEDTLENIGDKSIVRTNTLLLEEITKKEPTMSFIEEELYNNSYKIINLNDLVKDLEDAKDVFSSVKLEQLPTSCNMFDIIIEKINKGVENNGE